MAESDDAILDAFNKIGEPQRYPGSKKVIDDERAKRASRKTDTDAGNDEEALWVDNPYFRKSMSISGETVIFYTMAAMCEALHRKPNTVRGWEREGKFPKSPFKTKPNGAIGGKRLFTREQIERTRAIAEEEGLLYSQRPLTPRFTQRVTNLFNEIRTDIKKGN